MTITHFRSWIPALSDSFLNAAYSAKRKSRRKHFLLTQVQSCTGSMTCTGQRRAPEVRSMFVCSVLSAAGQRDTLGTVSKSLTMANDKKTNIWDCLSAWKMFCTGIFSYILYFFSLDFYTFQNEERQILKIKQATHGSQYWLIFYFFF